MGLQRFGEKFFLRGYDTRPCQGLTSISDSGIYLILIPSTESEVFFEKVTLKSFANFLKAPAIEYFFKLTKKEIHEGSFL